MDLNHKTLLITGLGNFIGQRTAELAIARGMRVRGLANSPSAAQAAAEIGAEVRIGAITEPQTLAQACQGVDIVFHNEAITQPSGDLETFRAVNVTGTVNVARAAQAAGVQALVHLSSVLVYGFNYPDGITEAGPVQGENNPFCQTKIESEVEVLKFNHPPQLGVVVIRAGDIYGPGAEAWVSRPLALMQQQSFFLVDGGRGVMNHLYIDHLVDGIFLAVTQGAYGEIFNLTDGCRTSWKDYYYRLAEIGGMPKPKSMPAFLVKKAAQLKGKTANISPDAINFVMRQHAYSIVKAQQMLNYTPHISLEEGMTRTAHWLTQQRSMRQTAVLANTAS